MTYMTQIYTKWIMLQNMNMLMSGLTPFRLLGNTQASRKKVLPIIKDFLREREQDGWRGEEEEEEEDTQFPPTPMNSLVEGCPLDNGLPRISAQALEEKFSKMADQEEHTRSP